MATQADYLVLKTTEDTNQMIAALEHVRTIKNRIVQRARALGIVTADAYANWPAGYTATDFRGLINALDSVDLPDSIVPDATRNRLHKLVASIQ